MAPLVQKNLGFFLSKSVFSYFKTERKKKKKIATKLQPAGPLKMIFFLRLPILISLFNLSVIEGVQVLQCTQLFGIYENTLYIYTGRLRFSTLTSQLATHIPWRSRRKGQNKRGITKKQCTCGIFLYLFYLGQPQKNLFLVVRPLRPYPYVCIYINFYP